MHELKVRMLIRPGLFLALVVGREEELIMIIFRCLFQGNLNESEGAGMGSLRGGCSEGLKQASHLRDTGQYLHQVMCRYQAHIPAEGAYELT